MKKGFKRLSSFQIIIAGFAGVIFLGALLLMLPVSSAAHTFTPFNQALFTSTSAVCVTGLIVQDTATYWSSFGQAVILMLIQIGGLGVMTVALFLIILSGRKISLMQRSTAQKALATHRLGGVAGLTSFILKWTFIIEFSGMLLMLPVFVSKFGAHGIWMSVFHSVSAFCNAGFDIMGSRTGKFTSLTSFRGSLVINGVIMLLIIIGGIGFLTWEDIHTNRFNFRKYRLQSKIIILSTAGLIIAPAVLFFFAEFNTLPFKERILASLFQSVTPRTAGFNTADQTALTSAGKSITIMLMLIGGSPGSTAGGMKTTTLAVIVANAIAIFKRDENANIHNRRIDDSTIKQAATIMLLYIVLFFSTAVIISLAEGIPMGTCLFETASAIGTVGLTLGITTKIGILSQMLLIMLMFFGRVGGLTLIYATLSGTRRYNSKLPMEKVIVG